VLVVTSRMCVELFEFGTASSQPGRKDHTREFECGMWPRGVQRRKQSSKREKRPRAEDSGEQVNPTKPKRRRVESARDGRRAGWVR